MHQFPSLSERLGLRDYPQDWGIANADPARLEEFVRVFEHESLKRRERIGMVELILASANDALRLDPNVDLAAVERLLPEFAALAEWEVEYWERLDDAEYFPLGDWLRERL